jgi:hypothetical protein
LNPVSHLWPGFLFPALANSATSLMCENKALRFSLKSQMLYPFVFTHCPDVTAVPHLTGNAQVR